MTEPLARTDTDGDWESPDGVAWSLTNPSDAWLAQREADRAGDTPSTDGAMIMAAEALARASVELDSKLGSSVTTIAGIKAATKEAIASAAEAVSNPISRQVLTVAASSLDEHFTTEVNSVPEIKAAIVASFTSAAVSLGAAG